MEQKAIDYEVELARCRTEIAKATEAIRTGISADTKTSLSAHEAVVWLTDWRAEEQIIRREMAKANGMAV